MTGSDQVDVVLVPDGRGSAVALNWDDVLEVARRHGLTIARAVAETLSQLDAPPGGRRYFTLRPEDERALTELHPVSVGDGYVRGFLLDDDKHFAHNIALRDATDEVGARGAASPGDVLLNAQMATITAQLDQIQDSLDEIAFDVGRVVAVLERDDAAATAAAVTTVRLVHATLARTGTVTAPDWDRAGPLEQVITQRRFAVVAELEDFARNAKFTRNLAHDTALLRRYPADRIRDLLAQETLLREAGLQWIAEYAATLAATGSHDATAVLDCRDRHDQITARADGAVAQIRAALAAGGEPRVRSWPELLLGVKHPGVAGRGYDNQRRADILAYRDTLAAAAASTLEPANRPTLRVVRAPRGVTAAPAVERVERRRTS